MVKQIWDPPLGFIHQIERLTIPSTCRLNHVPIGIDSCETKQYRSIWLPVFENFYWEQFLKTWKMSTENCSWYLNLVLSLFSLFSRMKTVFKTSNKTDYIFCLVLINTGAQDFLFQDISNLKRVYTLTKLSPMKTKLNANEVSILSPLSRNLICSRAQALPATLYSQTLSPSPQFFQVF